MNNAKVLIIFGGHAWESWFTFLAFRTFFQSFLSPNFQKKGPIDLKF